MQKRKTNRGWFKKGHIPKIKGKNHTEITRKKCQDIQKKNSKLTDREFIELYRQGLSDNAISKIFNCSHVAIQHRRLRLELPANYKNFAGERLEGMELVRARENFVKDNSRRVQEKRIKKQLLECAYGN